MKGNSWGRYLLGKFSHGFSMFFLFFQAQRSSFPPTHGTIKDCSYTQVDDDVAADLIGTSV
jgi:hypothetical protein